MKILAKFKSKKYKCANDEVIRQIEKRLSELSSIKNPPEQKAEYKDISIKLNDINKQTNLNGKKIIQNQKNLYSFDIQYNN